jgi:predicted RNase H-like HicB family nuclease
MSERNFFKVGTPRCGVRLPLAAFYIAPEWQVTFRAPSCKLPLVSLTYPVVLHKSDDGYAVNCPALPGCWSQGATEDEAVENIRDAIREYLAAIREAAPESLREIEVTV